MISPQTALHLGKPPVPVAIQIPAGWLDVLPPAADCLRDYQRDLIAAIADELDSGHKRILGQAPTGSGKTHIIAAIVMAATACQLRVLILATRTRLVRQIHERLEAFGLRHGVIAASLKDLRNYSAKIQVASVDTLNRRAVVSNKIPLPGAEVVIFDEAHLATAETRLKLLDRYPSAVRIGLTATPARKSGLSLGVAFESLVIGPSIRDLTAAGVLAPVRIFNTPLVTNKDLRTVPKDIDSDFKASALGDLLNRPKLVGDVVANWLRLANGKRTLCFAVNKAHGAALLDSFRQRAIAAEMIVDGDDEEIREEIIGRLESGETTVVINCFLMSYGVDLPAVEAIVLARPTRSLPMYLQMVGRGLRTSPGKTHCILIDHGHVVETLGLPQADHHWSLATGSNVNAVAIESSTRKASSETMRTCRECDTLWLTSEDGHACPGCGWTPAPRSKPVQVQEADLEELADAEPRYTSRDDVVIWFYREACGWYSRRWPEKWAVKSTSGRWWAWLKTQERFEIADPRMPQTFWNVSIVQPSPEVSGWLKSRLIAWAKAQAKREVA